MSEQDQKGSAESQSDPVKNLKSEFDRKLGNQEQKLSQLEENSKKVLDQLNNLAISYQQQQEAAKPKAATTDDEGLEDLMYSDPKKYNDIITQRAIAEAEKRMEQKIAQQQQAQVKQNETINALVKEYPELSNPNAELTMKAIEFYNNLPEAEKSSSLSYKVAVRDAAVELGIKPFSKRNQDQSNDDDSFTLQGGSKGISGSKDRKNTISSKTADFAAIMGVDLKDEKVKERIESYSELTPSEWMRYKDIKR